MHHPSDRNSPKGPAISPGGFIKEAVRLKFETDRSDHTKDCITSFRHIDQDLYSQILFLQNTLESHRQDETNEFHLLQSNIEQALHLVKKDIGNKEELEEEDKEYYQRYLNDLYEKINIFKALGGRAWDYILDEEMKLTREIDRVVSQMESWDGDMPQERLPRWKSGPFSASLPNTASKEEADYIDVQVFRKFLIQFGGRSGGWKTNDHTQFIKILNKYKGELEKGMNEIQSLFPDKSENDIITHYQWYKKYKVLKRNHVKALENWKTKQKGEIEEKEEVVLEEKKPIQKNNKDREEEKARIRAWKERKQSEEEEKRKQKEKEKLEKQERCRIELKQKRQMLARLVKENEERPVAAPPAAEEVHPPAQVEDRRRPRTTPQERIRHFQQQDREHIARLLELRNRRKQSPAKDKEQETQLHGKLGVSRGRDPSRIFQTTKATRARSRPCEENRDNFPNAFKPVPNIRKVPKLKIPEWRKNENVTRNPGGDNLLFK